MRLAGLHCHWGNHLGVCILCMQEVSTAACWEVQASHWWGQWARGSHPSSQDPQPCRSAPGCAKAAHGVCSRATVLCEVYAEIKKHAFPPSHLIARTGGEMCSTLDQHVSISVCELHIPTQAQQFLCLPQSLVTSNSCFGYS